MVEILIAGGVISLLAAAIGVLIALKIQSRVLRRLSIEHEAWEHSQEAYQYLWQVRQSKFTLELEQKLTQQVQHIQEAWQSWEALDEERFAKLTLEQKLAQLPRVEDTPVPPNQSDPQEKSSVYEPHGNPPSFYRANLIGRDLSHRFLRHADLRETQLTCANFYMADLFGACLTGANLSEANLAGANLTGADLRGAELTGANLLVTDLHNALLNGANLLGAHNLTIEQLNSAIYDSGTQIDIECNITLPHMPGVRLEEPKPTTIPASADRSFSHTPIVYSPASSELCPEAPEP
jgi:pentapeptide repeat protein